MRNIAFIVSLTTIFHAGHQGFVGPRAEQQDVTEDFAQTEENQYSDSSDSDLTTPSSQVTEAPTEVACHIIHQ